jgi:RNA polymerase sigma-70 factor, ECF subfamily
MLRGGHAVRDYSIPEGSRPLRYNRAFSTPTNFCGFLVYLVQDADDAALVSRSLAGETTAFETLVSRHQRPLYTVAYRMLGNREDAADALQGALIKAYEHLASFDPRYRFFSWIYRIVVNECLNMLRARRPEDVLNPALAAVGTPFDVAAAAQRAMQVQQALLQLTTDARAVIVLRHFGDLSYDQIAETLGVPAKTVKSRLHSARQKLGEQLLGWRSRS